MAEKNIAIVGIQSHCIRVVYSPANTFYQRRDSIPLYSSPRTKSEAFGQKSYKQLSFKHQNHITSFRIFHGQLLLPKIFPPKNKFSSISFLMHITIILNLKLNHRVLNLGYEGASETETGSWTLWSGTGEPFGPKGKWNLAVHDTLSLCTELHQVDFVIVCAGSYSDYPNIPEFPPGTGPEAFQGKVMHSMEYSDMDHANAAEYIQGKRVAVVGFQKSALDISMECSTANGVKQPGTLLYRAAHWIVPDFFPWGIVSLAFLYQNRFAELLVHKPGQGLLLSLLATFLSPLRLAISKFVESHISKKLNLAKHGMVPKHRFFQEISSCAIPTVPEGFFDRVEEGSIILKKAQSFSFFSKGVSINDGTENLEIDLLILATGFRANDKLKAIFTSPTFRDLMHKFPIYRECIHPRIPQLAFIGFSESYTNLFTSELTCRWLTELLDGTFKLPSIKEMERDVSLWDKYRRNQLLSIYNAWVQCKYGTMINCARIWAGSPKGKMDFLENCLSHTARWIMPNPVSILFI